MNAQRLAEIRARRERLLITAASQRDEVATALAPLRTPLRLADGGIAAVLYVRQHPGPFLLAAGVILVLSPRRTFRWGRRAFAIWRGYRFARKVVREFLP